MTNPITPPPELVQQWLDALFDEGGCGIDPHKLSTGLAARAAQWGADQELEACIKLLSDLGGNGEMIRRYRRPTPPQLKEQAQQALSRFDCTAHTTASEMVNDFYTIRRALEVLPDD
jgi:hypothetical protein